jgi:hypothetical protein
MQLRRTRSKTSSDSSANATPFIPLTEAELHELIAARAYELYLQRSTTPGDELSDWLEAETEVRATIDKLAANTRSANEPEAEKPARMPRTTRVRSRAGARKPPIQETPALDMLNVSGQKVR